jgi:hypothetical protein
MPPFQRADAGHIVGNSFAQKHQVFIAVRGFTGEHLASVFVKAPDSSKIEHESRDRPGPCDFVGRLKTDWMAGFVKLGHYGCMDRSAIPALRHC